MADLAIGVLRKKRDQLEQALSGHVGDHHRLMLGKLLGALQRREAEIAEDESDIRRKIEPFHKAVHAWMQIPGIDETTAWSLVAEMGRIWRRLRLPNKLLRGRVSVPETTKVPADGRTRMENPWLRSAICEAAWGASRTKKSYFHAQYARICARRGPNRALMAVAHSMIVVGFYLVKYGLQFKDLGADFFHRRNREHATRRAVKRLNALGYTVHLKTSAPCRPEYIEGSRLK